MYSSDSVAFYYKPEFPEREEDKLSAVVISTSGEVVELDLDGSVQSKCTLPSKSSLKPQDNSIILQVFYTYQPFFKFYLAHINNELFIIQKMTKGQLLLHKTISEVTKFFTSDDDDSGYPKIFVLSNGRTTPSTVDLFGSADNYSNVKLIGNALLKIRAQNQALNIQLKSAQNVLMDKKIFVSKLSGMNFTPASSEMGIPLISILGESSNNIDCSRINDLSWGKLWARMCAGSWVVGAYVFNELESELENLEMVIVNGSWYVDKLKFWSKTHSDPLLSDFNSASTIPPRTEGFIAGVIKDPFFVTSRIELDFVLIYHVKNEQGVKQSYLGNLDVSPQKYLSFNCCPFEKESDIADFISLRMVCASVELSYQLHEDVSDVHEIFCSQSFSKISEKYYICKFSCHSTLRGVLICLNLQKESPHLRIFFRRKQQLVCLLESFYEKLSWTFLTHDSIKPAEALYKELICLDKCIKLQSNKEFIEIPADYVPVLLEHERNTEMAFCT